MANTGFIVYFYGLERSPIGTAENLTADEVRELKGDLDADLRAMRRVEAAVRNPRIRAAEFGCR